MTGKYAFQQWAQVEIMRSRLECAGIKAGNVEQAVEEVFHRMGRGGGLLDEVSVFGGVGALRQFGDEQAQGVHGLAQVMTGGGKKAGFGPVGLFGLVRAGAQLGGGRGDAFIHAGVGFRKLGGHGVDALRQNAQVAAAQGRQVLIEVTLADALDSLGDAAYGRADGMAHPGGEREGAEQDGDDCGDPGTQQFMALLYQRRAIKIDDDVAQHRLGGGLLGEERARPRREFVVEHDPAGDDGFDDAQRAIHDDLLGAFDQGGVELEIVGEMAAACQVLAEQVDDPDADHVVFGHARIGERSQRIVIARENGVFAGRHELTGKGRATGGVGGFNIAQARAGVIAREQGGHHEHGQDGHEQDARLDSPPVDHGAPPLRCCGCCN